MTRDEAFTLTHADRGETLHRFIDDGWQILSNPKGGGSFDTRCMGGWWVYKGDEALARAEQARIWAGVLKRMDY